MNTDFTQFPNNINLRQRLVLSKCLKKALQVVVYSFLTIACLFIPQQISAVTIYLNTFYHTGWEDAGAKFRVQVTSTGNSYLFSNVSSHLYSAEVTEAIEGKELKFIRRNSSDDDDWNSFTISSWSGITAFVTNWNEGNANTKTIRIKITGNNEYLYIWGDKEIFGSWPGIHITDIPADANGWIAISIPNSGTFHPIFNNNNGSQFDYTDNFGSDSFHTIGNDAVSCSSIASLTPTISFTDKTTSTTVGTQITLSVTTTNAIGSTVTFTADGANIGTAIVAANGTASINYTPSTTGAKTIAASVTSYSETASTNYTLTVNAAAVPTHNVTVFYKCGSTDIKVSTTVSDVQESSGSATTVTAPAINGYTFSNWNVGTGVNGSSSTNSIDITTKSSGNYTLTANYTQDNYTITLTAGAGGSISSATSFTNKHYGDNITITATANTAAYYHFVNWSVESGTASITNISSASTTLTVQGNATIQANFALDEGYYLMQNNHTSGNKGSIVAKMSGEGTTKSADWECTTTGTYYFYVTSNPAADANTNCDYLNANQTFTDGNRIQTYQYGTSNFEHSFTLIADRTGTYTFTFDTNASEKWFTCTWPVDLTPSVSFSPASGSVIKNSAIDLTVTTANIPNGTTITYKRGEYTIGTASVSSNSATYRFTPSTEGVYTITASCTIDDTEYSDNFTLTVTGAPVYGVKTNFIDGGHCVKRMNYDESTGTYTYSGAKAGSDTYVQLYRCDSGDCTDCNSGWTYIYEWSSLLSGTTNGDMINFTYDPSKAQVSAMTFTAQQTPVTIRFDNAKGWGDVYLYVWKANGSDQNVLGNWPGVKLTMDEDGYYGYTFDGDNLGLHTINNAIFNNGSTEEAETRQTNDVSGTRGIQCYTINSGDRNGYAIENKGKMGYTASRNDCSPAEPELTATYTVNDAATIATITLTTTPPPAASTGASFAYSVRKTGETSWTNIEGSTATTTWTTEEDDWFEFKVVISKDGKTWTQTTMLNIRRKIIVRVKAFDSFEEYGMQLKYWTNSDTDASDYVEGSAAGLTQVGTSKWYEITIKGRNLIYFIVKGNGCTTSWEGDCNGWKRSVVVGPVEDDICIEITEDYEEGTNYKKYFVNSECGLFYRYESVSTEGTYYSNYFETVNTPVSMYVGSNNATRAISFQNYNVNTSQWESHAVTSSFSGKTRGIYQAVCTSLTTGTLSDVAAYTGNYYIRTDIAGGGWTNYRQLANQFFYFAPNSNFPTEPYNHYWCGIANQWDNVKAEVGNTINPCLAQTLGDYNITQAASMRFEYNPETNYFNRHFIKLTTGGNDYLNIYGATASDPVYKPDTDTQLQSNTDAVNMRMADMGNWVYKLDVEVRKATASDVKVILRAMYPIDANGVGQDHDVANYLLGADGSGNPTPKTILGSSTTNGNYTLKLIYDYKTNRLMTLYSAPTTTINDDLTINADMMMLRRDDEAAKTILLGSGHEVNGIKEIYSVLQITKTAYVRDRLGARNYYYWISLPYDCYLTDIFGMEDYGDKWTVQRYRGDKRAQLAYQKDWMTFWAEMNLTPTTKMEANRGYVIRVRLKESDFLIGDGGEYNRFLYFPSRSENTNISIESLTTTKQTRVAAHTCTITDREQIDSHWNIVGIPGFQPMTLATTTAPVDLEDALMNYPNFYYEWSFTNGEGVYDVKAITGSEQFLPMQSYMMQFYGYLTWNPVSNNAVIRSLTSKRLNESIQIIDLRLNGDMYFDHTYIRLREGATLGWDINTDLSKDLNRKVSIYSTFEGVQMAGNSVSPLTTEIPIGVSVKQDGNYTFTIAQELTNMSVVLYDNLTDTEILLDNNEYSVLLVKGTYDNRFVIRLKEKQEQDTPTATDTASEDDPIDITIAEGTMYVHSDKQENISIYTAIGQLIYSGYANNMHINVNPGIYFVHTNNNTYKVYVK
ncbi:MAG: starch-binding protein [Paludibacteraceae bacterium]|nr:starch-binding protein [Paludibacteraceae bacterium]